MTIHVYQSLLIEHGTQDRTVAMIVEGHCPDCEGRLEQNGRCPACERFWHAASYSWGMSWTKTWEEV